MALHIRKYHIGIGMLKRRRIFRSKDPHRIRSPSQITTSIHRSPITTHHMARIKRTPRQSYHIFRWYPGNPPSDDEAEAEADDVANELQPLPPPLPHPPGRSDDEDEDNVANELQPLPPPLPHPHGRPDDEEEEQDADGPDGEEEEQDNGGAYDVADEDDWDVETDEDAGDGNPEDTHVSSGRSDEDDDDEEEEEVEMNDEENVEIDDVENMVREEQVHQESGNSTNSDSNFNLSDEESSSIGTSVLEFSDGDGSDIIDLSGSHDKYNAGDIVIPVGQGMSYNDPIVLE